jgi:hypothetical protein
MQEKKKALIVVRTYPTPAKQGVEVSCTAAITDDGKWLRLFPVPYRMLDTEKRFKKYQWIEVEVIKTSDPRPESHKIRPQSIQILSDVLSTDVAWKARKLITDPLKGHCLCCLKEHRDNYGFPTLGLIKPKRITRLLLKKAQDPQWSAAQAAILSQGDLFEDAPAKELEKIPFSFMYEFFCDHATCKGHKLSCTDWEMGESWRKWKAEYGKNWESAFRQKYEKEMIEERDLHFFVGTVNAHPSEWIIVGLFYPPKFAPLPLFD